MCWTTRNNKIISEAEIDLISYSVALETYNWIPNDRWI